MKKLTGWHLCATDRLLGYGDNRLIVPGETLSVDCRPKLCSAGLHASERPIDAISYARGPILCAVELHGDITYDDDKACATSRHTLWMADATDVLRYFARWCALDVAHLWEAPQTVVDFLKTGDESKRAAAWNAARNTTWDAARIAAWDAGSDSAWAAAWDSTWAAVWSTWDSTWDAAWDSTWGSTWAAACKAAKASARATARDAARNATRDAAKNAVKDDAWDAARMKQNKKANELFTSLAPKS